MYNNLKITLITLLTMVLTLSSVQAQQDPMFTQYFSNQVVVNPAYTGSRDGMSIVGLLRHQWTGFAGAPRTQTLSLHSPLGKSNSNLGFSLIHDQLGITERYALNGSYAYRIDFGRVRLAMGLHGQVRLRQMRWDRSNPLDQADGVVTFSQRQLILPNVGAGIYLDGRKFFVGVAMPHLLENELPFVASGNPQGLAQLRRHFFATGGLIIPVGEQVKLRPMMLWKYVQDAPMQFDFNLGVLIKDQLLVGGTYRTRSSADVFVQYDFPGPLRLGYAYDFPLTGLRQVNSGSHEVMLGLDLGRKNKGFDHPRYF